VGPPLTEGEALPAEVATLDISGGTGGPPQGGGIPPEVATLDISGGSVGVPQGGLAPSEVASVPPREGKVHVVVVAVDSSPFCVAAFRGAVHMLDNARAHYHMVHVRPTKGTLGTPTLHALHAAGLPTMLISCHSHAIKGTYST